MVSFKDLVKLLAERLYCFAFPVSLYPSQRLMWSVCFVLAILIGVESHLIVFLTCISLIGDDFEYLSCALWPSLCPLW